MQVINIDTAQNNVIEAQLGAVQNAARGSSGDNAKLREAAEEFESIFLSQMLQPMFNNVGKDTLTGGGPGTDIFKSMFVDEIGKAVSRAGGVGIADQVYTELLKLQEA